MAGIFDALDKLNPVKAIDTATQAIQSAPALPPTDPQAKYEAAERAMNRNNPSYAGPTVNTPTGTTEIKNFKE